jgi:diguanylate cyclase (GGDEF)-like protein
MFSVDIPTLAVGADYRFVPTRPRKDVMTKLSASRVTRKQQTGVGVTTRLMVLVLIPVTVACAFAGSVIWSLHQTAGRAQVVSAALPRLGELVSLQDGLHALQALEQFDIRFAQLGSNQAVASAFLGVDLRAIEIGARRDSAAAAARLGNDSPVNQAELSLLFTRIDQGVVGPVEALRLLTADVTKCSDWLTRTLNGLVSQGRDTRLVAPLDALRTASGLADAGTPQGIDLSTLWFPSPGDVSRLQEPVLADLGATTALFAANAARLHELNIRPVVAKLDALERDPGVATFNTAIANTLRGQHLPPLTSAAGIGQVMGTFHGFLIREDLIDGVVTAALSSVRAQARGLAAAARNDFLVWTVGAFVLALASIGIAVRLSRSISRPLKDLAVYAHAISEGRLETESPSGDRHAPRETRVALAVFGDLVDNLKLLDAKANALAHCDFDNPVLGEPLPGRLGSSLENSVTVLSSSIVERDLLQTHLAHQATHDALTGILNRPAAIVGIESAMHRSARTGATTALLFIDLNEFKSVNDSHGHEVGDTVLKGIASRIASGLRDRDFVARLGGDEFIVVTEDVTDISETAALARRLIELVEQPFIVGSHRITIGAAVGIALNVDGPEDPLLLLARADAAMYRAKGHKRSAIEIFDANLQRDMLARADIESALADALVDSAGGGLSLHYQPILDTASGALARVEALIRWDRPGIGMLPPDQFIPIAEGSPLIIAVDRWVIDHVTAQLAAWSSVPELANVPAAVNISGRHLLSGQLPGYLSAALEHAHLAPGMLSIELTETVVLDDLTTAAAELDAVRALGVSVAIDDFGTGYTSLAHLQRLPIDSIKIDRSFISQLEKSRGLALVRMVTVLGHAIDVTVVGEGVETPGELRALQLMGADQLQGYLLSRPLPPEALITWVRNRAVSESVAS